MHKPYFPSRPGQPPPLRVSTERLVRFEELDPLGIVWHGCYASYFEDGRAALGDKYGIGYLDFHREKVLAPIRALQFDYRRPLSYGQRFAIEAILHWSEAARLNYEFILRNEAGEVTTTGCSVQMMMDQAHQVLLTPPAFYRDFIARWGAGKLA